MNKGLLLVKILTCAATVLLVSCANTTTPNSTDPAYQAYYSYYNKDRFNQDFASRLPPTVDTDGQKLVLVDPNVHAWGAYAADGHLVRAGIATAGAATCPPDDPE